MDLTSLMPMLMMGSSDKGVAGLVIAALLTLLLKYFDLNDAMESARAYWTRKTMTFTMEARVTKDNENTMSRAFSAVAYRVHTALITKPPEDPIWKHIHDVKEITLSARSIVANVFSRGYCVIDGVKISISRQRETEQVQDSEDSRKKVTEKVSTWYIRLESGRYDTIDRFVKGSMDTFDEYLKKMSSESRQTLFVASHLFRNCEGVKVIYEEEYFSSTKTFDNLMFPRKRELLSKIDRFQNDEDWFARLGRPYKLNMMFSGAPGTSKTSCIKAIANYTGRHVVLLRADRFESMSDMCDAITGFSTDQAIDYRNCMFVIEEMDCMEDEPIRRDAAVTNHFVPMKGSDDNTMDLLREIAEDRRGPKKKRPSAKASLGTMLNTFDGFQEMHGCMIIVTTNHPEKFDPALTRPGRLDPFEFQLLGAPEINGYWKMYFGTDVPPDLAAEMKGVDRVMSTADLSQYLDMGAGEAESGLRAFVHALKNKA